MKPLSVCKEIFHFVTVAIGTQKHTRARRLRHTQPNPLCQPCLPSTPLIGREPGDDFANPPRLPTRRDPMLHSRQPSTHANWQRPTWGAASSHGQQPAALGSPQPRGTPFTTDTFDTIASTYVIFEREQTANLGPCHFTHTCTCRTAIWRACRCAVGGAARRFCPPRASPFPPCPMPPCLLPTRFLFRRRKRPTAAANTQMNLLHANSADGREAAPGLGITDRCLLRWSIPPSFMCPLHGLSKRPYSTAFVCANLAR